MNIKQSWNTCWNKYAVFKGRASRSEFWWFQLSLLLTTTCFYVLEAVTGKSAWTGAYGFLFILGAFMPNLSVIVRRFHDINISTITTLVFYFVLVGANMIGRMYPTDNYTLVLMTGGGQFIGWIIFIYFLCKKGTTGVNEYGEDPLKNNQ